MGSLLRNMEIHLTIAGLVVIGLAGWISSALGGDIWMVTAITATGVGALHGVIFWLVRRRQRQVRQATIQSVQSMLKDVVKNQLAVLQLANELNHKTPGSIKPETFDESIRVISAAVDTLSQESLQTWQARYERS